MADSLVPEHLLRTFNLQPAALRRSEAALKGAMLALKTLLDSFTYHSRFASVLLKMLNNEKFSDKRNILGKQCIRHMTAQELHDTESIWLQADHQTLCLRIRKLKVHCQVRHAVACI